MVPCYGGGWSVAPVATLVETPSASAVFRFFFFFYETTVVYVGPMNISLCIREEKRTRSLRWEDLDGWMCLTRFSR